MPIRRGNTYSTRMRVPARFQAIEPRTEVWISLGTSDLEQARIAEVKMRAAQLAEWEERAGIGATPEQRHQRMSAIAAARGFDYMPADELGLNGKLDDILSRLNALDQDKARPVAEAIAAADPMLVSALFGAEEKPVVMLSGLVEYIERLESTEIANRHKDEDQTRKWRNPRKRAISNLRKALKAAGRPDDIPVESLSHEIATLHWNWSAGRIKRGEVEPDTAKKDYDYFGGMLKAFYLSISKPNPRPYSGLSHTDRLTEKRRKPEFAVEWIEKNVIAPGSMAGLNDEARDITIIAAETGCRQSEIYNTPPEDWHLNEPIPYFMIQPIDEGDNRREIKNIHSKRPVALVGAALEAAKRRRGLFPRYRGSSTYSDTVNKWFRENKLFPTEKHTIGGLRHSFESRMKAIGLENEDRGTLMGHSRKRIRGREVYGDDLNLEMRYTVAMLIGVGPLVDGPEREAMARRLRKLLDELKEAGE